MGRREGPASNYASKFYKKNRRQLDAVAPGTDYNYRFKDLQKQDKERQHACTRAEPSTIFGRFATTLRGLM